MEEIFKISKFWFLGIIISAVIFFVGINLSKIYESKVRVLIIPKNEISSKNIDQIINNAQEIPFSLNFYNKLTANEDFDDEAFEFADKKRKAYWNSKLKIKRIEKSGILEISIRDKNQWQSEIISQKTAQDLAVVMSKYYNIKTDLDLRIIDGPIAGKTNDYGNLNWIISSLIVGFLFSFLINSISLFTKKIKIPERITPLENVFISHFPSREEYNIQKRKVKKEITPSKKAPAPANLPIAEKTEMTLPFEAKKEIKEARPSREATPEEIKERLNRLLRGEM